MRRRLVALLAPIVLCVAANPLPDKPRDISALLAPILAKHAIPGMAAAIVSGKDIEAIGASGVREQGKPDAVTIKDTWHLGSCTKSMTATLCAMLVEEGRLEWDTTIGESFPELADSMKPAWKPVTLHQLLCHRAGVPSDLSTDGLWDRLWKAADKPPTEQRRMLLDGILAHEPVHAPGSAYLYANAGYSIAGTMIGKVTGSTWEDLMRERLFEPLKMESAGFGAPGTADKLDQPRGHREDHTPVQPGPGSDNPAAIGPGGTVHCTIGDWANYISLHVTGDPANPHPRARLLKAASYAYLHTPYEATDSPYGNGWQMTERDWGGHVLTHNGTNTMWYCVTWLSPSKDFAVLVTCNIGGAEAAAACDEAAGALIQDHLAHGKER